MTGRYAVRELQQGSREFFGKKQVNVKCEQRVNAVLE
jgi:hypothetical protein